MKQEIGKINKAAINSLSIQISLNGHSFLYTIIDGTQYGKVFVIDNLLNYIAKKKINDIRLFIPQQKHISVPADIYCEDDRRLYLFAKSITTSAMINSDRIGEVVIVYPILDGFNNDICILREKCDVVTIYNSLTYIMFLLEQIEGNGVVFSYTGNIVNIVAKKGNHLRFIDIFSVDIESIIIDLVDIVVQEQDLDDCKVAWVGKLSKKTTRILQSCYNID